MAKNQSAEKEEFWRMALIEQQASGMTIKAFCSLQGLSAAAFSWWKREIKKRDQRSKLHSPRKSKRTKCDDTRLIPVNVTAKTLHPGPESDSTEQSFLEVVSPTGYTFRISSGSPSPYLTVLLDAVAACNAIGGKSC